VVENIDERNFADPTVDWENKAQQLFKYLGGAVM
jgi:hypothetical protein